MKTEPSPEFVMVCNVLEDTRNALMADHFLWNPLLIDEVRVAGLLPWGVSA